MKRLAGAVLGLLLAQVCCELGLPHREPEGVRRCSIVEGGEELTSPADFLSFSSSVGMGWGHFQGLVGVTVTLTVTVALSSSGV